MVLVISLSREERTGNYRCSSLTYTGGLQVPPTLPNINDILRSGYRDFELATQAIIDGLGIDRTQMSQVEFNNLG